MTIPRPTGRNMPHGSRGSSSTTPRRWTARCHRRSRPSSGNTHLRSPNVSDTRPTIADALVAVSRRFHARGWVLGTSGNFSAVVSHDPLRLAITASSLDKGVLDTEHILHVGEDGVVVSGIGRPSAETLLHVEIVRRRQACAVLHT